MSAWLFAQKVGSGNEQVSNKRMREKEMIKNRQVCETCKHWQVGNYEPCLKKFICHLPDNTCLNWEEGIKAEYYPYPPNATWEEKEEINKKHIEEWKKYLKPLAK